MSSAAPQSTGLPQAPRLRLLPKARRSGKRASGARRDLQLLSAPAAPAAEHPVLIAGGDSASRKAVMSDLTRTMPSSTTFEQVGAIWEVLVRAGASRMVILNGELEDVPAQSLMQMVTHRHPEVPVVCLAAAAA